MTAPSAHRRGLVALRLAIPLFAALTLVSCGAERQVEVRPPPTPRPAEAPTVPPPDPTEGAPPRLPIVATGDVRFLGPDGEPLEGVVVQRCGDVEGNRHFGWEEWVRRSDSDGRVRLVGHCPFQRSELRGDVGARRDASETVAIPTPPTRFVATRRDLEGVALVLAGAREGDAEASRTIPMRPSPGARVRVDPWPEGLVPERVHVVLAGARGTFYLFTPAKIIDVATGRTRLYERATGTDPFHAPVVEKEAHRAIERVDAGVYDLRVAVEGAHPVWWSLHSHPSAAARRALATLSPEFTRSLDPSEQTITFPRGRRVRVDLPRDRLQPAPSAVEFVISSGDADLYRSRDARLADLPDQIELWVPGGWDDPVCGFRMRRGPVVAGRPTETMNLQYLESSADAPERARVPAAMFDWLATVHVRLTRAGRADATAGVPLVVAPPPPVTPFLVPPTTPTVVLAVTNDRGEATLVLPPQVLEIRIGDAEVGSGGVVLDAAQFDDDSIVELDWFPVAK